MTAKQDSKSIITMYLVIFHHIKNNKEKEKKKKLKQLNVCQIQRDKCLLMTKLCLLIQYVRSNYWLSHTLRSTRTEDTEEAVVYQFS